MYKDGKLVNTQKWRLSYPPTRAIIRQGTGPEDLKPHKGVSHHRIPRVVGRGFSMSRPEAGEG